MKIGIAFPARDIVNTAFAFDLASMIGFTAKHRPDIDLVCYTSMGTMIFDQRIKLARESIGDGTDYTLWLDTDMRFPKDALIRLLGHDKAIVGANYTSRQIPPEPVSFILTDEGKRWRRVPTLPESKGLERVDGLGFGVCLTKTSVLKSLDLPDKPMFWFQYSLKNQTVLGEDIYFCINAATQGYEIHIDHDLSKEVKHQGMIDFQHEHVDLEAARKMRRELDAAERVDLNKRVPLEEKAA